MKIVFFGSSKYSLIVAKSLFDKFPDLVIVTNPNRIGSRNKVVVSPLKDFAKTKNLKLITFENLDNANRELAKINADFFIVSDYAQILPDDLLNLPKFGCVNVHQSLLPKYRGPSPAPNAILRGDKKSGVTIISMTSDVDAGNIIAQKEYSLKNDETTDTLLTKLNELGAQLLPIVINSLAKGEAQPKPQDNSSATYTSRFTRKHGYIELTNPPPAEKLDRMIRAYYPWPGVWTKWNGKIIKFYPHNMIQPEGKRKMSIKEFLNGYPQAKVGLQKILESLNP